MEQEIGNISIALIRKLNPAMKGIGNDFIMDSTEYYIPDVNSIFKYPLRLDGIIIAVRKQGSATININLREYNTALATRLWQPRDEDRPPANPHKGLSR